METQTVKLPKALTNMMRKVMPWLVVATKHSQGEKDLGYPEIYATLTVVVLFCSLFLLLL
jgi:hypothetical protein